MPRPALKTNSLLQEVQNFMLGMKQAQQIDIRRLLREAEAIKKESLIEGLLLEGLISVLSHDANEAKRKLEGAICASGDNDSVRANVAVALFSMGEMSECVKVTSSMRTHNTSSCKRLLGAGAYAKAADDAAASLLHSESEKGNASKKNAAKELALRYGLDDSHIVEAIAKAGRLVWGKGIHLTGGEVSVIDGEILHTLHVPQYIDDQTIVEIEWEMDKLFAQEEDRIQLHGITIEILPHIPEEMLAA